MDNITEPPIKGSQSNDTLDRFPLTSVRGLPMPSLLLDVKVVNNLLDYKPRDTDIFIVTYPKCGTTWAQFLVWEIMHKGAVPPSPNQMMFYDCPFLEYVDVKNLEHLDGPRPMKTHLPFHLQPYNPKAKYIYVVRNPYDCCTSYYHHPPQMGFSFDRYVELFIEGEVGWGDFFDHVLSWYPHRNDPNVLFLCYEDMKEDVRNVIFQIAKFLGESFYEDVRNEEIMENCIHHSDFKYLKNLGFYIPDQNGENTSGDYEELVADFWRRMGNIDIRTGTTGGCIEVPFFRKGEVGNWRNHFSQAQLDKFNKHMEQKLLNTEMKNFWEPELFVSKETNL